MLHVEICWNQSPIARVGQAVVVQTIAESTDIMVEVTFGVNCHGHSGHVYNHRVDFFVKTPISGSIIRRLNEQAQSVLHQLTKEFGLPVTLNNVTVEGYPYLIFLERIADALQALIPHTEYAVGAMKRRRSQRATQSPHEKAIRCLLENAMESHKESIGWLNMDVE